MAAFDFPSSPNNGDTYSANGIDWIYNGSVWKKDATAGVKGQKGEVGVTGDKGQKGEKGEVGPQGDKGQKGEIGATGGTGGTGTQGDKGQKGEIGAAATKGQKGEIGATGGTGGTGNAGSDGSDGDKGQKGEVGSITAVIPSGGIIIWSGAANAIPSGWYLCNGSNGTPNLSGRFVVGYSASDGDYDVGDTGGAKTDTVTISGSDTVNISVSGSTGFENLATGGNHISTGAANRRHTHSFSGSGSDTVNISGSDTVNTRPPYYALCYIMKS